MRYYLYHLPVNRSTGKFSYENRKLIGEYDFAVVAKNAARRFINKGSKICIITSKPPAKASDILYIVQYQDGKKYWKDPKIAEERSGWVFIPVQVRGTTEVQDYRGNVKRTIDIQKDPRFPKIR